MRLQNPMFKMYKNILDMGFFRRKIIVSIILSGLGIGIWSCSSHYLTKSKLENDTTLITFNQVCIDDSVSMEETITSIMENGIDEIEKTTNKNISNFGGNLSSYKNAEISSDGIELIKQFESCRLTAYKLKGEKYYTIGYGHVIYPGDNTPMRISRKQANRLLRKDIKKYNAALQHMLSELDHRFKFTQSFIDGLGSLVYNCGPDGVKKTNFWKRMKQCRFDKNTNNINIADLKFAIAAVKTANISRLYKTGHTYRRKIETRVMIQKLN